MLHQYYIFILIKKNRNNKVKIITGRGMVLYEYNSCHNKTLNLNFKIENNCLIV